LAQELFPFTCDSWKKIKKKKILTQYSGYFSTFNNISVISWWSVLLVEETEGPRENQCPVASHWQTLSYNFVHLPLIEIRTNTNKTTTQHNMCWTPVYSFNEVCIECLWFDKAKTIRLLRLVSKFNWLITYLLIKTKSIFYKNLSIF
jgi:hypothetical protein